MDVSKKKSLRSSVLLTLTALIWGVAFVAQSEGMNYVIYKSDIYQELLGV